MLVTKIFYSNLYVYRIFWTNLCHIGMGTKQFSFPIFWLFKEPILLCQGNSYILSIWKSMTCSLTALQTTHMSHCRHRNKKNSATMVNWIGENVSNNVDWIPNDLWFVFDQSTSRFQSFLFPEKGKKVKIFIFGCLLCFLTKWLIRQDNDLAWQFENKNWQPNYVIWGRYWWSYFDRYGSSWFYCVSLRFC